jgi:hypothetical protein
MSDLRRLQAAFTVDLSKYGSGLETALSVFVHPGGASNRPGLEFVAEVKDSTN